MTDHFVGADIYPINEWTAVYSKPPERHGFTSVLTLTLLGELKEIPRLYGDLRAWPSLTPTLKIL